CARKLIDLFAHVGLADARDETFNLSTIKVDGKSRELFLARADEANDPRPEAMLKAVHDRGGKSVFLKFLQALKGRPSRDAILAAVGTPIPWGPLVGRCLFRATPGNLPWDFLRFSRRF